MSERPPSAPSPAWKTWLVCGSLLAYAFLFYLADPARGQSLLLLFVPDELLLSWVGGDVQQVALFDRWPLLLGASFLLGTALLLGQATLSGLRCLGVLTRLETLVFALGVGLSQLSLATLGLGLCGLLQQRAVVAALVATVWLGSVWRWCRGAVRRETPPTAGAKAPPASLPEPARAGRKPRSATAGQRPTLAGRASPAGGTGVATVLERHGWWLATPFVVVILLGGMLPPWEFDVREYHLQVPKEWFLQGRIEFLPHNVYGNMPLGAEMPALLAMTLCPGARGWWWGALVGKTLIASVTLVTAVALLAAGQRFANRTAGVVAALVYLSTPWILYVSVTGLIDGVVGCYLLLAFYAWGLGRVAGPRGESTSAGADPWVWLAGFLAGSAAACKYPALVFVVGPLFLAVLVPGRTLAWRPALHFTLAVACACGPWLAKNAWFTGNPVYPLAWGGATRTGAQREQWNRAHQVPPDEHGRRYSLAQAAAALATVSWRSSGLSPLLVPLALLACVAGTTRRLALWLSGLLLYLLAVWWLCSHRLERFLVPAVPIAALLAGLGGAGLTSRLGARVQDGILAAGLAASLLLGLSASDQDHRYLVGLEQLRRDVPAEPDGPSRVDPVHRYLNDTVAPGCAVLLVGDAQPFDLEPPVFYNTCFDDCILEQLLKDRTREQRLAALHDRRISHVYVHWSEIRRYRSPGNYGFTPFVTPEQLRQLVAEQVLRPVDLRLDPRLGELFEVVAPPRFAPRTTAGRP